MNFFGSPHTAILAVCTANLCRSPMAEGLLRKGLSELGPKHKVRVMSAGTRVVRTGHAPDARAQKVCAREGIDIRKVRTRQVRSDDFKRYSYILAMDQKNYRWLYEASPSEYRGRISLLGSWAPDAAIDDIADPYYGSSAGFDDVFAVLRFCVNGFLAHFLEQELFRQ